ncbi:MAG: CBS domain-containing protein [Deltaproteobacteria bacterium]|nr:CBS domain-containing protein [Deltaproteobacteria bacterium]
MDEPVKEEASVGSGPWALSDEDVLTAMKEIGGYIDITTGDFKEIYRVAQRTAWKRLMENVRARSLMTREVVRVERKAPLLLVAETMARHNISGVPVLEADSVVGLVTEKDFLRRLAPQGRGSAMGLIVEYLQTEGETAFPLREQRAEDIMTSPAITLGEDSSLGEILRLFRERAINRAPVLAGPGRLVGIVTRDDVLRILAFHTEGSF